MDLLRMTSTKKPKMSLQDALKWADDNSNQEAVDRMRSRQVAQILANTVRTYADYIATQGEITDTCTFNVLGVRCNHCQCHRSDAKKETTINSYICRLGTESVPLDGTRAAIVWGQIKDSEPVTESCSFHVYEQVYRHEGVLYSCCWEISDTDSTAPLEISIIRESTT